VLGERDHLDFIIWSLGRRGGEVEHGIEDRRGKRKDVFEDVEAHSVVGLQPAGLGQPVHHRKAPSPNFLSA
jgi:hypothetical protein